jgi:hypothetical protein
MADLVELLGELPTGAYVCCRITGRRGERTIKSFGKTPPRTSEIVAEDGSERVLVFTPTGDPREPQPGEEFSLGPGVTVFGIWIVGGSLQ